MTAKEILFDTNARSQLANGLNARRTHSRRVSQRWKRSKKVGYHRALAFASRRAMRRSSPTSVRERWPPKMRSANPASSALGSSNG